MTTCACQFCPPPGIEPWTADFHKLHKAHHLAKFPATSIDTIASLDLLISLAEKSRIRAPRIRGERGCI